jgi:hypothetical protein
MKPSSGPEFVFHYTSFSSALQILDSKALKCRPLAAANDLFEQKKWLPSTTIRYKHSDEARYLERQQDVISQWARIRDRFQLFSTHYSPADADSELKGMKNGRSNLAMWAYYGDNHAGCCLVFHRESLSRAIRAKFDSVFEGAIDYRELNRPNWYAANSPQGLEDLEIGSTDLVRAHIKKYKNELFFRKSPEWNSENEWRWIIDSWKDGTVEIPLDGSLKEVVLGEKRKLEADRGIIGDLLTSGAGFSKVWWEPNTCKLEVCTLV